MTVEIKAPAFPESVADGVVSAWHKGPGDSVSPNQHLWLGRLHNAGVPVAVAYVSEGRTPPDTATGIVLPFTH